MFSVLGDYTGILYIGLGHALTQLAPVPVESRLESAERVRAQACAVNDSTHHTSVVSEWR